MIGTYVATSERQSKLGEQFPDPNGAELLDKFDDVTPAFMDVIEEEKSNIARQQLRVRTALQKIATTLRHIELRSTIKLGNEHALAVEAISHPIITPEIEGEVAEVTTANIDQYMRFWTMQNVRGANKRLFVGAKELLDASFSKAVSEKAVISAENDNDAGDIAIEKIRAQLASDIALVKQAMWLADGREAEMAHRISRGSRKPAGPQ